MNSAFKNKQTLKLNHAFPHDTDAMFSEKMLYCFNGTPPAGERQMDGLPTIELGSPTMHSCSSVFVAI